MGVLRDPCAGCGMHCLPGEYHPYTACVLFRQLGQGDKVRSCLEAVMDWGRQLEKADLPNTAKIYEVIK